MADIRLLGPIRGFIAGREIDLGHAKQRAVLAALAVDAGHRVSIDVLLDRVWGEDVPPGARSGLYSYVARLRRSLAAAGGGDDLRLVSEHGGYRLDADPDAVDLHRFRRLRDAARACGRDAAEPGTKADAEPGNLLDRALELWRGEPLAGLTGAWPDRIRQLLNAERLEAAVLRAQARQRVDRPAPVEELRELLAQHPLSEPLIACLLEALHRQGRRAEALDLYAQSSRLLADELGVDPGTDLRSLHQAILRDRPDPPAPTPARRPTGRTTKPTGPPLTVGPTGTAATGSHTRRAMLRHVLLGGAAAATAGFYARSDPPAAERGTADPDRSTGNGPTGRPAPNHNVLDARLDYFIGAGAAPSVALLPARDHSSMALPDSHITYPIEADCMAAFTDRLWPDVPLRAVRGYPLVRPDDTVVLFGSPVSNRAARTHFGDPFRDEPTAFAVYGDGRDVRRVRLRWNLACPPDAPALARKQYGEQWRTREHRLVDLADSSDLPVRHGTDGTDYFLISAIPRFAQGPQRVLMFSGAHGPGTRGAAMWLRSPISDDCARLARQTGRSPYFQALFEVSVRERGGEPVPTRVRLIEACPLEP